MTPATLNTVTDFYQPALEALQALGRLNAATVEKLAGLQLASAQANTEVTVSRLKAGTELRDLDSVKAYLSGQPELANAVLTRWVAESKTLAGIASDYGQQAARLIKAPA